MHLGPWETKCALKLPGGPLKTFLGALNTETFVFVLKKKKSRFCFFFLICGTSVNCFLK